MPNLDDSAAVNKWIKQQVREFKDRLPLYEQFGTVLDDVLDAIAKKYTDLAIIEVRVKTVPSFTNKALRKRSKYSNPVDVCTDLCGGRIIVHTADEVRLICEDIERLFDIDWDNSVDVSQRLKPTEFGYRSVHYIVGFKDGVFPSTDVPVVIPPVLYERTKPKASKPKAEIQVRTFLEHTWASIHHDLAYKGEFRVPDKWEREFAALAAMLESVGDSFSRIVAGLRTYSSAYGAYMSKSQIRERINMLEIVLEYDEHNFSLVSTIGQMAIAVGDWGKAIGVLSRYADSRYPSILKNLGIAKCKLHIDEPKGNRGYVEGQGFLEQALEMSGNDVDIACALAETYDALDEEKARGLYQLAYRADPSDPNALVHYLKSEITFHRDISVVPVAGSLISAANQKCREQADVNVNLPWAFIWIGELCLLSDNPLGSLSAFTKAIDLSTADFMIQNPLESLKKLSVVEVSLQGYQWVYRLLLLGLAVKYSNEDALSTLTGFATKDCGRLADPVLIVAGGCDPSLGEQIKTYRQLVLKSFQGYMGTVVSGGTVEGISGLVGEMGNRYDGVRTVGYLPRLMPTDARLDQRYTEIRCTNGEGFSPLEPLQNWIDIVTSGIKPSEVKVLGINGGPIAAFEFRLALALGATVGIVEESGRESARLLPDDDWKGSKNLVTLPAEEMTVRAFVGSGATKLPAEIRGTVAQATHEEYRRIQREGAKSAEPSMADWSELRDDLKKSNLDQADHIMEKVRQIGCSIQQAKAGKPKLMSFTDNEVEIMAKMEHGRWNVERLLSGWTYGQTKDAAKKSSPYLVGWAALPENVKEWDRNTVRKIPEYLAGVGLEIRRDK